MLFERNGDRRILASRPALARLAWLLITLVCATAARAGAQRAELERLIQHRTLPNGLEVIVIENHGVPLVTLEAVVRNGSFTQTPEYEGLSHVYEHMFFKANGDYPDADGVAARAASIGALFNAETHEEEVNYYMTMPADSLDAGLLLLNSALRRPEFSPDELAREKVVVLGEYDRDESEPFWHLEQAMAHALWGNAFSRKNPIGSRSVVANVTREQMQTIQRRYYVPNNTALIIAGDVAPADAFARAARVYEDWPKADDPFVANPIPPVPPVARDTGVIVEQDVGAVTVLVQWQGPSVTLDPHATFVADAFSDYLNLPGSEFQRRLVDTGLWQGVLVNYYTLAHVGPITVSGQTTPDKLRAALPALMRELSRVGDPGYFTPEKLAQVKAHRATDSAFGRERTSGFSHAIAFWWSVAGLDYYMRYVDEMAKQGPSEMTQYARRYILGQPHVTGAMLSPGVRARLALSPADLVRLAAW